jgi:hypothetical protein
MNARTLICILLTAAAALTFCPSASGQSPAAQAVAAGGVEDLWTYTLPGAKVVAGVDWKRAKTSETGAMLMKKLMGTPGAKSKMTQVGLDFVDGFDRLLITSPGQGPDSDGKNSAVIAVAGRFDRAKLKKSMPAGTAVERFRGIDLFVPPSAKTDEMVAGWVSETLMLMGDRDSIADVLDARSGIGDPALLSRAKLLETQHEFWMIADVPPYAAAGSAPGAAQGIEDIRSMEMAISLRQGLGLKASFTMSDTEKAQGAAMLAQMFSAFPSSANQQSSALSAIAKNLSVKVEGPVIRANLNLSLAQLERAAVEVRAGLENTSRRSLESLIGVGGGGAMPAGSRAAVRAESAGNMPMPMPAVVAPAQPVKRTIRIVGLDDGVKEVSYTSSATRN